MRTERTNPRATTFRPAGRSRATLGAAYALGAGVLILLLAPTVLAGATPLTTSKPPFTNATFTLANPKTSAGCQSAKLVTKAFFNKTTGIGGFSSRDNATWCAANTNNSVLQEGKITITIPITVTKTGIHNITVVWDTIATGSVNLTAGRCAGTATSASSSCVRFVQAFVFGTNFLLDNNTKTHTLSSSPLWPGNSTSLWSNTSCAFKTCTTSTNGGVTSALHTGNAFWSWDWNSIFLNASHTYTLHLILFGGTQVTLMTTGGATLASAKGNAQFNSGTLGNEEKLLSITVA
jgi:hypothetical protein